MRVLHIGSFQGNIGDQLNHKGFRPWFESLVGGVVYWEEIEIREVYRKKKNLFDWLSARSQSADLVIFGGGNFWELWPENSKTGTSIDLELEQLLQLEKPCFFNALGVDGAQGVSPAARRFPEYLSNLQSNENFFVTARNDGANSTLDSIFGPGYQVDILPDHGFFAKVDNSASKSVENTVCLNLASDMREIRFKELSYERTLSELLNSVVNLEQNSLIRIVPHVLQDIRTGLDLVERTSDSIARERTAFASLDTSGSSVASKFSPYLNSRLNIVNRFHANVFCLAQGLPLLPLVNYPQIKLLLDGLPEAWPFERLTPENVGYWAEITEHAYMTSGAKEKIDYSKFIMEELRSQRNEIGLGLVDWLRGRGLIS